MVERVARGLLLMLVVALVGCDHATKVVAKITLEGSAPKAVIPGVLDLVYTENRDTAFSLFHGVPSPAKGPLILVVACLAMAALVVARGHWVDFIHLRRCPVFTVAAVAICGGGALVGVVMMRSRKRGGGGDSPQ